MSSSQSIINSIESQTNCPWDPPTWSAHPDGRIEPVPITRSLVSCRFRFHTFDERFWAVDYSVQEYSRKFTLSSILFPDCYQFFFSSSLASSSSRFSKRRRRRTSCRRERKKKNWGSPSCCSLRVKTSCVSIFPARLYLPDPHSRRGDLTRWLFMAKTWTKYPSFEIWLLLCRWWPYIVLILFSFFASRPSSQIDSIGPPVRRLTSPPTFSLSLSLGRHFADSRRIFVRFKCLIIHLLGGQCSLLSAYLTRVHHLDEGWTRWRLLQRSDECFFSFF